MAGRSAGWAGLHLGPRLAPARQLRQPGAPSAAAPLLSLLLTVCLQEMLDDDLRELEASTEMVKSVSATASPVTSPTAAAAAAAARREGNAEKTL